MQDKLLYVGLFLHVVACIAVLVWAALVINSLAIKKGGTEMPPSSLTSQ